MPGAEYNKFYKDVGRTISSKPPQALKEAKKTKAWEKQNLDYFERIGEQQFLENLEFKQYYDMISGRVSYSDITDTPISMLEGIIDLRDKLDMPTDIQHFDFIGQFFHHFAGTWAMMNDKFSFASIDEVSTNEFMRQKTDSMLEYTRKTFELEKNKRLIQSGFPLQEEFKSEEEQAQYMQQLEQQVKQLFPERTEADLRKNFKTDAAQWAENTFERDYHLFEINDMEYDDAINIMVMGYSPRHIHIGHDFYKPEQWDPIHTFFGKEHGLKNIEDSEFAGRIVHFSPSEFIDKYGTELTFKQQKEIINSFGDNDYTNVEEKHITSRDVAGGKLYEPRLLPFQGADDLELTLKFQEALGVPLGLEQEVEKVAKGPNGDIYTTKAGQEKMVWLHGGNEWDYSPYSELYSKVRPGYKGREDVITVTEVYWRGFKWMGILFYEDKSGNLDIIEVDENILPEFLKENEITTTRVTTISEALKDPKPNTLVPYFQPIVYKGVKANKRNTNLTEDIYLVKKLEFQIKGSQSNIYNLRLPISSIITEPLAPKLKPFQRGYDFEINKILSLSEKELGTFFIFDINFLPTEFIDMGSDAEDALTQLYNLAKTFGIMPVDISKHNTAESGGVPFNPLMQQSVSFTQEIQVAMQQALFYKHQAMDLLGLNPTVIGSPGKYETAEGVQVSQTAHFAQTENIYAKFFRDKLRKLQTHITVAQYAKLNNKDATYLYQASDGELAYLHSIKDDKYFALRDISVVPLSDPKKIKEFEAAKQMMLQMNTMGSDELAYVNILASDDVMELKKAALDSRLYKEQQAEKERQSRDSQLQAQLQAQKEERDAEMKYKYDALANRLEVERIEALGRAADNLDGTGGIDNINQRADIALQREKHQNNVALQDKRLNKEIADTANNVSLKLKELQLKKEQNDLKRKEIETKRFTSVINKN